MTDTTEQLYSGKAQVHFCQRLGDSWRYLAMYLEIPDSDSNRFEKGGEGREILQWLRQRNRLDEVPEALEFIGRPELALVLRPPTVPAVETRRWERDRSPYPGLAPFTAKYAPVFFGRDRNTAALIERLKNPTHRFIAVVGASGSGKSSLVAAGLLPRLKDNALPGSRNWIVLEFRPGGLHNNPFERLAYQLEPLLKPSGLSDRDIYNKLHARSGLSELARRVLAQRNQAELLLFIDQFEELFTLCSEEHRPPFISMLDEATDIPGVRIVITLRSDFVSHCLERHRLAELLNTGFYSLPTPNVVDLYEMITRPAALAGLRFEDQELPLEILNDTGNEPGALALMAAALAELYEKRMPDGTLTRTAYEELGKVEGVIAKLADEAYEHLDIEAKAAREKVFRELVGFDEHGIATRRRATLNKLLQDQAAAVLVHALTSKRLLVTSRGEDQQPLVEVAHEALLRSWPLLAEWIRIVVDDYRLLRQVQSEAANWNDQGRPDALLWLHERLLPVQYIIERLQPSLNETERVFVRPETERLFEELTDSRTSHYRRAAIGDRLAQIGDVRRGVGLRPDSLPDIDWVFIPSGHIGLEDGAGEFDVHPFHIARFPITWQQYRVFLKVDDGYFNDQWWKDLYREKDPSTQYRPIDNCPAENVSWFDTLAFCRWLTVRFGFEVRLPFEYEWQLAAICSQPNFNYPWGSEWQEDVANTRESHLNRTTAVGLYPDGKSPSNVLDMAGNVWEWCLNKYGNPRNMNIDYSVNRCVVRGGSWNDDRFKARVSYRDYGPVFPRNRFSYIGFRVACVSPIL